jgi:hypothetical protein
LIPDPGELTHGNENELGFARCKKATVGKELFVKRATITPADKTTRIIEVTIIYVYGRIE